MKVLVLQQFRDKVTGETHKRGSQIDISEDRAIMLQLRNIVAVSEEVVVETKPSEKRNKRKSK